MAYCDYIVWLDLETTGVDEVIDHILEIGMVVTEPKPPFTEVGCFQSLVAPVMPEPRDTGWLDLLDPKVLDMHSKNRLLSEIQLMQRTAKYLDLHGPMAVENEALDFLADFGDRRLLAGSGVGHFDRRFLRMNMPDLNDAFLYPVLDVGVIRRTLEIIGREDLQSHQGEANDLKPHRALDDAELHAEEFRHYADLFSKIGEVVS